jgi:outer membrane lipoprotein-sorting protein
VFDIRYLMVRSLRRRWQQVKRLLSFILFFLVFAETLADQESAGLLFEKIKKNYETIFDYQCRIDTFCTDGNRNEKRLLNFYFKKPRMIRIDLLKGNQLFDAGSVGVFKGGETVTGHRGGILSSIVMTVHKKSTFATTLRGEAFDEIDMEAVLYNLLVYLKDGACFLSEDETSYMISCIPYNEEQNKGISKDIAWFDKDTLTITRFQRYEGATLVQEAEWSDYIINAGIPDKLFDPQFDPEQLRKDNIPVLKQEVR